MKFVFLYRGGNVPQEQMQQNMQEWGTWIGMLVQQGVQKAGLPFTGGKIVSQNGTEEYKSSLSDVSGYSEIEAESLDKAVEISKGAPNVKHGGTVEVRQAMDMPGM